MPKPMFGLQPGNDRFGPAANSQLSENVSEMISHGKQIKDFPLASA
jgi:hypothetical protein